MQGKVTSPRIVQPVSISDPSLSQVGINEMMDPYKLTPHQFGMTGGVGDWKTIGEMDVELGEKLEYLP